jgi:hypothetical protein
MTQVKFIILGLLCPIFFLHGEELKTEHLTLTEAIRIAQLQSVDAAVALNELKVAYWE